MLVFLDEPGKFKAGITTDDKLEPINLIGTEQPSRGKYDPQKICPVCGRQHGELEMGMQFEPNFEEYDKTLIINLLRIAQRTVKAMG